MKLSERNKDTDRQVRKKGVNQRIQIQTGGMTRNSEIFRCEKEERENRYWMEGEERRWRMCYEERERDVAK
jgi:hypothetical protein